MGREARLRQKQRASLSASPGEGMGRNIVAVIMDWPYQMVPWIYMASLWQSDIRAEPHVMLIRTASPHIDAGINASIQYALDNGATEILFGSCDQSFPPDWLTRCRRHGKPVIGALYASRQGGHPWLIWDYNKGEGEEYVYAEPKQPFQRVAAVGGGMMYIKADVFRTIPRPWFRTELGDDGFSIIKTNDYLFFKECEQRGIEVYVDNERVSDHLYDVMLNAQSLGRSLPKLEVIHTSGGQRAAMDSSGFRPW